MDLGIYVLNFMISRRKLYTSGDIYTDEFLLLASDVVDPGPVPLDARDSTVHCNATSAASNHSAVLVTILWPNQLLVGFFCPTRAYNDMLIFSLPMAFMISSYEL